jgi:hypothetical protein
MIVRSGSPRPARPNDWLRPNDWQRPNDWRSGETR